MTPFPFLSPFLKQPSNLTSPLHFNTPFPSNSPFTNSPSYYTTFDLIFIGILLQQLIKVPLPCGRFFYVLPLKYTWSLMHFSNLNSGFSFTNLLVRENNYLEKLLHGSFLSTFFYSPNSGDIYLVYYVYTFWLMFDFYFVFLEKSFV